MRSLYVLNTGLMHVQLSTCLVKHHAMKEQRGDMVQVHAFLASDGGKMSNSRPDRFDSKEKARGNHYIGWGAVRPVNTTASPHTSKRKTAGSY
jgi:hypothetical protein